MVDPAACYQEVIQREPCGLTPQPDPLVPPLMRAQIAQACAWYGLRPRQADIVWCLVDGIVSNAQIAAHLGINESTVKTYFEELYAHLGVHSRLLVVLRLLGKHPICRGMDTEVPLPLRQESR